MNRLERKMVDLLKGLRENHHVSSVKMEFETEGTRLEEAMRLKEISMAAGLSLTLKVGGCEAIKDMFDAGILGTAFLVSPMIETPYALKKYIQACQIVFTPDQMEDMEFYINLETITAMQNFERMLMIPEAEFLDGVVLGRVDLCGSMSLNREFVNSSEILDLCLGAAQRAKSMNKKVIVGGAVSMDSVPFFQAFPVGHLDKFETRKVVFDCPGALDNRAEGFFKAVEFEIMWLKNKKEYYGNIHREDDGRLQMMEARYNRSKDVASKFDPNGLCTVDEVL